MKIGDKVKLSEQLFLEHHLGKHGKQWRKAKARRFRIKKFLPSDLVRVQRVDRNLTENYWIGFLTLVNEEEEMERGERIIKAWCQWNRKELKSDDFAYLFGQLYEQECLEEWNKVAQRS